MKFEEVSPAATSDGWFIVSPKVVDYLLRKCKQGQEVCRSNSTFTASKMFFSVNEREWVGESFLSRGREVRSISLFVLGFGFVSWALRFSAWGKGNGRCWTLFDFLGSAPGPSESISSTVLPSPCLGCKYVIAIRGECERFLATAQWSGERWVNSLSTPSFTLPEPALWNPDEIIIIKFRKDCAWTRRWKELLDSTLLIRGGVARFNYQPLVFPTVFSPPRNDTQPKRAVKSVDSLF